MVRNHRMSSRAAIFLLALLPLAMSGQQRGKFVPPDFDRKMEALKNLEHGVAPLFVLGDLNEDGVVDEKDLQLAQAYAQGNASAGISCLAAGDLNSDGAVDAKDVTLFQQALKKGPIPAPPLAYHSSLRCDYKNFFVASMSGTRVGGTLPVHFLDPRFNAQNSSVTVQSGQATAAKNGNAYRVQVAKTAPKESFITLAITLADNRKYTYTFQVH